MLRRCAEEGCSTLTLGTYCVEHEQAPATRPSPRADAPVECVRAVPPIAPLSARRS